MIMCRWRALDRNVLAVAVVRKNGFKKYVRTYIGAVPGKNHENEFRSVVETGSRVPKSIAEKIFPSTYSLCEEEF